MSSGAGVRHDHRQAPMNGNRCGREGKQPNVGDPRFHDMDG